MPLKLAVKFINLFETEINRKYFQELNFNLKPLLKAAIQTIYNNNKSNNHNSITLNIGKFYFEKATVDLFDLFVEKAQQFTCGETCELSRAAASILINELKFVFNSNDQLLKKIVLDKIVESFVILNIDHLEILIREACKFEHIENKANEYINFIRKLDLRLSHDVEKINTLPQPRASEPTSNNYPHLSTLPQPDVIESSTKQIPMQTPIIQNIQDASSNNTPANRPILQSPVVHISKNDHKNSDIPELVPIALSSLVPPQNSPASSTTNIPPLTHQSITGFAKTPALLDQPKPDIQTELSFSRKVCK